MSVARANGSKPLAFLTALMVLFALVIPLVGSALANHAGQDPTLVTLTPDQDTEQVGVCNAFQIQARRGTAFVEGETIDIRATQSDSDVNQDVQIQFCDPDAGQPGSNLGGPNPDPLSGQQTGNNTTPAQGATDCDDDNFFGYVENDGGCPTNQTGGEAPAQIWAECFTDAQGNCVFGVTSNEAGTMNVDAWFDANEDDDRDTGEPFDQSTKTWTGTPAGSARNIACTPATDSNPEGSRHEFRCTVTDANGRNVSGATVQFDVTAGPNAEEINRTPCGPTDGTGQTAAPGTETPAGAGQPTNSTSGACGYNDNTQGPQNSLPGRDTITAWVNLGAQPGQAAPTDGLDTGEPSTTITKNWVGPGRVINCEPETATNPVGTTHTITCTVTDAAGNPVVGVTTTLVNQSGPGTVAPAGGANTQTTNANGQTVYTIATAIGDATGTSNLRGTITGGGPSGNAAAECAQPAGTPAGAPAGACTDDVQKTWTRQGAAQCNDNVDNDGDGFIDHGQDPGCTDINDNSEGTDGTAPPVEEVRHARNIQITGFDHVKIPGKRGRGLIVRGRVSVDSGYEGCRNAVPVKVQINAGGEWITRKTDTTNNNGVFKVLIRDVEARYRAIATKHQIDDEDNSQLHICQRASDTARHRSRLRH